MALGTQEELGQLLQKVQFLGKDEDRERLNEKAYQAWDAETPVSMQVIKSSATALTTKWTKFASRAGGSAAALSLVAGGIGTFVDKLGLSLPVVCTLIASGVVLAVAVVIGIAVIVSADLRTRGVATAARNQGRAAVTTAFLTATPDFTPPGPSHATAETALMLAIASPWTVLVTTRDNPNTQLLLTGVQRTGHGLRFVTATDVLSIDEITSWSTRP